MIKTRPGFIARDVGYSDDGFWYMDLRFQTKQHMDQWMFDLKREPSMKAYGALIDFASMRTEFYTPVNP